MTQAKEGAFMKSNPRLSLLIVALAAALGMMAAGSQTAARDQNGAGAKPQVHSAPAWPGSAAPYQALDGPDAGPESAPNQITGNRWVEH